MRTSCEPWRKLILAAVLSLVSASSSVIPGTVETGPSKVQFTSGAHGFDAPKVHPINQTVFDWWYFDAVSEDDLSSVVVTFFTSTSDAFPFIAETDTITPVYIWTTFPNGTKNTFIVSATSAVVQTNLDGSSGVWEGTGASWAGTPDMSHYVLTIDDPNVGVRGTLYLESRAPGHYPCDKPKAGADMQVLPNIGWANAVPDAKAIANFEVLGSTLSFNGVGYHDKNWSDRPFASSVQSWLWGHATLGSYSIVWFDALDWAGNEYVSGYVARRGKVVTNTCETKSIKVRLNGENAGVWPPSGIEPDGYSVQIDLGKKGLLQATAWTNMAIAGGNNLPYTRWIGNMTGTIGDSDEPHYGVAVFEQFVLG